MNLIYLNFPGEGVRPSSRYSHARYQILRKFKRKNVYENKRSYNYITCTVYCTCIRLLLGHQTWEGAGSIFFSIYGGGGADTFLASQFYIDLKKNLISHYPLYFWKILLEYRMCKEWCRKLILQTIILYPGSEACASCF